MSEAIAAEDKLIDLRKSLMEAIEEHRRKIVALENQLAGINAGRGGDAIMRDIDEKPYSSDELRVAEFFASKGAGGGDDPIAFMLCSYEWLVEERKTLRAALNQAEAEKAAWVDMAHERGLGDPEETAFQLDGDSKQIANQKHNITELLTERDTIRAELAVVREALEWYADQNNWKWSNGQGFYASAVHMIMSDQGHRARNALQSHRRTEEGT